MKKLLATTAILSILSTSAFALGNNTNNPTANGGNATQGQVGINSLENDIVNKNKSNSKSNSRAFSDSDSKSGVYGSGNSANLNAQVDASRTSNKQKQDASSSNDIAIGGDNYVEAENVVNTAYAPTVIATSDCLGSVSGGGMGTGFGASLGFTTNSNPCNIREDAKLVAALTKDENLVKATLCQSDRVKEAYKVTGEYNKYCVGAKATVKTRFFGLNDTSAYEEQDACSYPTPACKSSKR